MDNTSTNLPNNLYLPGKVSLQEEMRIKKIKQLRGKYKNRLTPSDEFAKQKMEEEDIEAIK